MTVSKQETYPPGTYLVTSLGCKVNQAEAAWLGQSLAKAGWSQAETDGPAELVVVLTCSVTAGAARQSRQMARRLARAHPRARVIVTGCDSQVAPDSYHNDGFEVAGRSKLAELPGLLIGRTDLDQTQGIDPPDAGPFCPGLWAPGAGRSRCQLKVQDGCDANCAYCIVPSTRGLPRSLPLAEAARYLAALAKAGAAEVVVTGIHLGLYGRDLQPRSGVVDLLKTLLAAHPSPRLRLSSLEVGEATPDLLGLMAREPRICPHLHLPLQSGSNEVLKAMGRPYSAEQYADAACLALDIAPGLCLGADVLVGLPGEDQAAFEHTRELVESLDLAYLHVFPYSPRPGTRAAEMARPHPDEAKARATVLRELGKKKRLAFLGRQVGRSLEVIAENSGLGRSENYCLVELDRPLLSGAVARVKISSLVTGSKEPRLVGRIATLM